MMRTLQSHPWDPTSTSSLSLVPYRRRRGEQPAWRMLLLSRDFGAIAVVNAIMFATANGSRSVLVPLLATQSFGLTTTALGALSCATCQLWPRNLCPCWPRSRSG